MRSTAGSVDTISEELLPTRPTLLSRLKTWDDQRSWTDFAQLYSSLIYNLACRSGLDHASAQDVLQETLLSVAKSFEQFEYDPARGSFKSWLLTITRRRISDHLRKLYREPFADENDHTASTTPLLHTIPAQDQNNLEQLWDEEWTRKSLEIALQNTRQRVKPLQFQLFDCYVLQGWPMRQVTESLGVTMAQVYFAKYKVAAILQKELNRSRKGLEP